MACNKNCSDSCNSCGCFGALNCVAGPLTHCGCCAADSQYYQNYPFYTGPCGPVLCTGCGCNKLNRYRYLCGWNGGCSHCAAPVSEEASNLSGTSALFHASAPLLVEAGGAIPLSASVVNRNYFDAVEEGVLIRRPGTYMAIYSMHVPAMQALSTRTYLTLNGNILEDSVQDISTAVGCTTGTTSVHLIFHALPNSLLQLVSTEELNLVSAGGTPHVFRLTLIQL